MQLTKRAIEALKVGTSSDQWLWDTKVNGFGIRVKPTGRKTYVVQYRNEHGRTRRFTLGQHGVLTVSQARKAALHSRGFRIRAAVSFAPSIFAMTHALDPSLSHQAGANEW